MRVAGIVFLLIALCSCAPLPERGDIVRTALEEYESSKTEGVNPSKYIPAGGESRYRNRWCGEFVQWVYAQHMPVFEPPHTGTRILSSVFLYFDSSEDNVFYASSGDTLFFDFDNNQSTDHIGILIGWTSSDLLLTVEGNIGGQIVVKERSPETVLWVGRLTKRILTAFPLRWQE
jgi:hypothetical protein